MDSPIDESPRQYRMRRRWAVCNKDGRCTFCHPHRGENDESHGRKDRRWVDGRPIDRKPKDTK